MHTHIILTFTHAQQLWWFNPLTWSQSHSYSCPRNVCDTARSYRHMEKCNKASNCQQLNIYHCNSNKHVQERITEKECVRYNSRRSAFWKQNNDIFNIFTVQKLKPYIQTNRKNKLNIHSKIQFCCQSELFACVWIRSPSLRGREYKLHLNLTSCSSFKFSYTMKVMLFTVPICLKACLYLVCACVCKSAEKSPIY